MKRIKEIADRLFNTSSEVSEGKGIYVSLEELIEQKQYTKFVKYHNPRTAFSNNAGDIKSAFKGRGMEFEEIRAYQYGDEVRDIDWRVTARKMQPYTKLYNEEKNRDIYVFLDLSPSMIFGTKRELKSVSASKVAALLGWISLENKDKFGCFIFDGVDSFFFKPKNSRTNLLAILKKISEVSKKASEDRNREMEKSAFEKSLQILQKSIKSRAEIFLISDFYNFDEKIRKNIATISHKGKIFMIGVFDKVEKSAPKSGEYLASNKDSSLVFNTGSDNFKNEYIDYFVHKNKIIKDFCLKFSLTYMSVSTAIPIFRQIKLN